MTVKPDTLCRVGAWGQIGMVAFAGLCWSLRLAEGLFASCIGYLLVTVVGIGGIAKTESAIAGPIVYPFILPGFVPLYYVATR